MGPIYGLRLLPLIIAGLQGMGLEMNLVGLFWTAAAFLLDSVFGVSPLPFRAGVLLSTPSQSGILFLAPGDTSEPPSKKFSLRIAFSHFPELSDVLPVELFFPVDEN